MVTLLLGYLDYVVAVLERVEYVVAALAFLKCELLESPRQVRQQLQAYPQLLQDVESVVENWDARNRFLSQPNKPIANEALLWAFDQKTAHDQARQWWIKFLESIA